MKKSKWLDCQGNEFFPKQKGTPSLVKIEHKNTATLDSARSKKKILSRSSATINEECPKLLSSLGIDRRRRKTIPLWYSPGEKRVLQGITVCLVSTILGTV